MKMFQNWIVLFLSGTLFIISTLEAKDVCNDVRKPDETLYCSTGTKCCNNGNGICCSNITICCLKIFCCPTYLTDGAITAIIVIGSVFVLLMCCCVKKCIEKCTCKKTKVQLIGINRKHNKRNDPNSSTQRKHKRSQRFTNNDDHNDDTEPGMPNIRKYKMSQLFANPYAYNPYAYNAATEESDISTISKHKMGQMYINPYEYSLLPGEISRDNNVRA